MKISRLNTNSFVGGGSDRVSGVTRYRFDELRRFATALGQAMGLAPARASALATHLLWFDAAGAAPFGIAALADSLERIEARRVDPAAEGRVTFERAGTALLDGLGGLPLLILARAAELAVEKARDCGVGLVRVSNVAECGPAAGIAAEIAKGPFVGLVLGPGPSWSVALPAEGGLPLLFDSSFPDEIPSVEHGGAGRAWAEDLLPWASVLTPDGGWLVAALSVVAMEPLGTFQERVTVMLGAGGVAGSLRPETWETRRREVRERGVPVEPWVWDRLARWADRYGIGIPPPCAES